MTTSPGGVLRLPCGAPARLARVLPEALQKLRARSNSRLIGENYRRIVTPVITDLDVSTWQQRGGGGQAFNLASLFVSSELCEAKCYLTWDADFKWFESDDPWLG